MLCFFASMLWSAFLVFSHAAPQAALFFTPAAGTFLVGSTFDVSIVLDTKGTAINTVEVELEFPADKMQIASPSVGRSIVQLWPAPPVFSNREGRIYFVGGIPSPGIVTSQGVVLTLTFRVTAPGEAELKFGEKTRVLANDGRGTDVIGQRPSAFFKFEVPPPLGPSISSPTHPDQEKWYRDNNAVFLWPKGNHSDGYSFGIDRDPAGFPDTTSESSSPTASFQNLENGIWYFHLRERAGGVWGGVSHYVVKIDAEPPAAFRINISPGRRTVNQNPILRFFTTDALSGLDHYEMKLIPLTAGKVSEALFFEAAPPYQFPTLDAGRYQLVVRALDKAGNTRDEALTLHILGAFSQFITPEGLDFALFFIPWQRLLFAAAFLMLAFIAAFAFLWTRHRHHLKHAFREDIKRLLGLARNMPRFPTRQIPPASLFIFAFIAAVFFGGMSVSIAALSAPPKAPSINISPEAYYPLDEMLYIEGKASPGQKIQLYFERSSGGVQPVVVSADANSNGEWFFSGRLELAGGQWSVRARVLSDPPSDWSTPRLINSRVSGLVIGSLKIKYAPVVFTFLAMLILAAGLLGYSVIRLRSVKRMGQEREIREKTEALEKALREKEKEAAASLVEQNFADLRRNIMEELLHYDKKFQEKGEFTKEEAEHRTELLRELNRIEAAIAKKLKEIN